MGDGDRIDVLDWLRGLAALSVAYFHFTSGSGLFATGLLIATGRYGWLGVEAFFVISGFVIPFAMYRGGYRSPADAPIFVLKRLTRLEPPYLVSIAITVTLLVASAHAPGFQGQPAHLSAQQILSHLAYLNVLTGEPWLNPVFWTLAIEFQFYVSMMLLYPLVGSQNRRLRLIGIGLMAALAPAVHLESFLFPFLGLFALGAVAFHARVRNIARAEFALCTAGLSAVTGIALGPAEALVGLITATFAAYARVPRMAPMAWLGAISYSVYLLHVPVGGRVMNLASRLPDALHGPAILAAFAASLLAAWALYTAVERPSLKLASRFRYRGELATGHAGTDARRYRELGRSSVSPAYPAAAQS